MLHFSLANKTMSVITTANAHQLSNELSLLQFYHFEWRFCQIVHNTRSQHFQKVTVTTTPLHDILFDNIAMQIIYQ